MGCVLLALEAIGKFATLHLKNGLQAILQSHGNVCLGAKPGIPENVSGLVSRLDRSFDHPAEQLVFVLIHRPLHILSRSTASVLEIFVRRLSDSIALPGINMLIYGYEPSFP